MQITGRVYDEREHDAGAREEGRCLLELIVAAVRSASVTGISVAQQSESASGSYICSSALRRRVCTTSGRRSYLAAQEQHTWQAVIHVGSLVSALRPSSPPSLAFSPQLLLAQMSSPSQSTRGPIAQESESRSMDSRNTGPSPPISTGFAQDFTDSAIGSHPSNNFLLSLT